MCFIQEIFNFFRTERRFNNLRRIIQAKSAQLTQSGQFYIFMCDLKLKNPLP